MRLLYCDESNLERRDGDFLIYAGVSIPCDSASVLHDRIEQIRADFGIAADIVLKFNPRPNPLTHLQFVDLKQSIIEAAIALDCQIFAYGVMHNVAGNPDTARRFGINTVCYHFHCALNRADDTGLVLIDRFNDQRNLIDGHLQEKMSSGVRLPHLQGPRRLSNILGFHYSAIGQSHFSSLIDILVGSLRYCINVHTRQNAEQRDSALNLLTKLSPLFYRFEAGGKVPDIGFCFSPMSIRVPQFHEKYINLQAFLREAGIDSDQDIRFGSR